MLLHVSGYRDISQAGNVRGCKNIVILLMNLKVRLKRKDQLAAALTSVVCFLALLHGVERVWATPCLTLDQYHTHMTDCQCFHTCSSPMPTNALSSHAANGCRLIHSHGYLPSYHFHPIVSHLERTGNLDPCCNMTAAYRMIVYSVTDWIESMIYSVQTDFTPVKCFCVVCCIVLSNLHKDLVETGHTYAIIRQACLCLVWPICGGKYFHLSLWQLEADRMLKITWCIYTMISLHAGGTNLML